jgi:hypothetical protein
MGIFRLESAGSTVGGRCSYGGSLCARGVALTPSRFFLRERALKGGKPGMADVYSGPQRIPVL